MKSHMSHQFSRVPSAEIQRSSFDRSCTFKGTFNAGLLIPILVDEVLPGDTFNVRMSGFARLNTPIHPIMDNMRFTTFFFFVPNRLLWNNWQRFCGEQDDPGDSIDFTVPTISDTNVPIGTLSDYFGIPTGLGSPITFNSLHHRAYNLIWNEWFRDQNMQDSVVVDKDDGPDNQADYVLLSRGKRHDYFTSCLPWPQKGDSISIPLGTTAPVHHPGPTNANVSVVTDSVSDWRYLEDSGAGGLDRIRVTDGGSASDALYANLTDATAATINELRQAFQIQRLQERDARGGTRYTEIIRAHFGVVSPDARLQRPEYLGGGVSPVNISAVPQTSETSVGTPQGNLAAFGTAVLNNHGFTKSFTEHGVLIGLVSVQADLTYQQGLNRMWSRQTRYDFYWPALAHIGEQAVLNKEIFADGSANDELVFGYQERFAEMRYCPSRITGLFRSSAAQSLDPWHLAQDFATLPALNDAFITDKPPIDRVVAVPTEPDFKFDAYFSMRCARPMPLYGVPGMIDHF